MNTTKLPTTTRASSVDAAKVIQVIEITAITGRGTVDDPVRQVVEYWTLDGQFLARKPEATQP